MDSCNGSASPSTVITSSRSAATVALDPRYWRSDGSTSPVSPTRDGSLPPRHPTRPTLRTGPWPGPVRPHAVHTPDHHVGRRFDRVLPPTRSSAGRAPASARPLYHAIPPRWRAETGPIPQFLHPGLLLARTDRQRYATVLLEPPHVRSESCSGVGGPCARVGKRVPVAAVARSRRIAPRAVDPAQVPGPTPLTSDTPTHELEHVCRIPKSLATKHNHRPRVRPPPLQAARRRAATPASPTPDALSPPDAVGHPPDACVSPPGRSVSPRTPCGRPRPSDARTSFSPPPGRRGPPPPADPGHRVVPPRTPCAAPAPPPRTPCAGPAG